MAGRVVCVLALVAFAWAVPARANHAAGHAPSAEQIYDHALSFTRVQAYPPYISYVVTVHAASKKKWLVEQFHSLCRTSDDHVMTDAKPLSSTIKTQNPYGFNVFVRGLQIHDSQDLEEPFGLPEMSPIFSFGLVKARPSKAPEREYDVSLDGTDVLHVRAAYHLTLVPLAAPSKNRLRELWVDAQT